MSQQHVDVWNQAADAFDQAYQAIGDNWEASTPCSEYNVQQLVEHTLQAQHMGAGLAGIELPEGADWPAIRSAVSAGLTAESLAGTTDFPPMGGEVPKGMLFGIVTSDLLLHSWDLARAVGSDETLPAEAVSACYTGMKMMPEEMMRADGRFAPAVECAADADEQTQLLCHTGRQP